MTNDWVKMSGPFSETVQTPNGRYRVGIDGNILVPLSDVKEVRLLGGYFVDASVRSVKVGDYLLFQAVNGNLEIRRPDPAASDAASAPHHPMPTVIATLTLTTEQANYLSDLRRRETNFDPSVVIGGPRQRTP